MERIMAILTNKQETLVGTIGLAGMPTHRTGLTRVVGIDFDSHTFMQEGFVGNVRVQLSETPTRLSCIGFTLFLTRFLAVLASCALTDVGQVLQPNQRVGVLLHNALTHHMVSILLQPSLSSADLYQFPGSRASAFVHQTLPQSCIMVGFRNKRFARMERTFSLRGARHCQVTDTHINTDNLLMGLRRGTSSFYLKCDQQGELLLGWVIPELGGSNLGTFLDESDVLVIAGVGKNDTPLQRQDTHTVLSLETIVMPQLVGERRRDILRRIVQPFVAFLGQSSRARGGILFDLCPQCFVRSTDLPGDTTGHLRGEMKPGAYLSVGSILQLHLVTYLAILKCVLTHIIERVAVRQLGCTKLRKLLWCRMQFNFGCSHRFHTC